MAATEIPATPPDVPSGNVSCPSALPNPVSTPADLQGLIGLCDNQAGTQLEIINFSDDVLDIYPAAGTSIADCVNNSVTCWQSLQDQPPPSVGQLLYQALQETTACQALQDKVHEYLESRNEPEDVSQETLLAGEHSDESDWSQQSQQEEEVQHDFVNDIR